MRRPTLVAAFALAVAASAAIPAAATTGPAADARTAGTPQIPPPRHQGTLRVTGDLQDGGTVGAAGLS